MSQPNIAPPSIRIRTAAVEDVPIILQFIRELAEYERLTHEVRATESLLREHLFGPSAVAEAIIGESAGRPEGFALYFRSFSTFLAKPGIYLEDLYVRPSARGQGIGRALLQRLASIAAERGCGRLEWAVLDWNQPAIGFYQRLGAKPMNEWTVHRLTGDALEQLARQPM